MSQQFFLRPSKIARLLEYIVHLLALLALSQTQLGAFVWAAISILVVLSACRLACESRETERLVLGEKGCFLNGQAIRLLQQFYDTPWLCVLRFEHREPTDTDSIWQWRPRVLLVLPDSMDDTQRRALSRLLRWQ